MANSVGIEPAVPTPVVGEGGHNPGLIQTADLGDVLASLTDLVPSSGSTIESGGTFAFSVLTSQIAQILLVAFQFLSNEQPEIAYDGTSFLGRYLGKSAKYAISEGIRFVFGRDGGWPTGSVTPQVYVVTIAGNVVKL